MFLNISHSQQLTLQTSTRKDKNNHQSGNSLKIRLTTNPSDGLSPNSEITSRNLRSSHHRQDLSPKGRHCLEATVRCFTGNFWLAHLFSLLLCIAIHQLNTREAVP